MSTVFRFLVVLAVSMLLGTAALAAGMYSSPPISNKAVDTNGTWSCHINDTSDKETMTASAEDYDNADCTCSGGNRIDMDATAWSASDGELDYATGATNSWLADSVGQFTLTVTFHDLDDGADCDDDPAQVQKTLKGFRVGCNLTTTPGDHWTRWCNSGTFDGSITWDIEVDIAGDDSPDEEHDYTQATWTVVVDPDGTNMKGDVKAKCGVFGSGDIYGATSDYDVEDYGLTTVAVGFNLGLVSISISSNRQTDDAVSTCGVGVGMASELHGNYEPPEQIELVSATANGPTDEKEVSKEMSYGYLIGKPGTSKTAEWELAAKTTIYNQTEGSDPDASSIGSLVHTAFTVANNPTYER